MDLWRAGGRRDAHGLTVLPMAPWVGSVHLWGFCFPFMDCLPAACTLQDQRILTVISASWQSNIWGLTQSNWWTCHAWGDARAMEQLMSLIPWADGLGNSLSTASKGMEQTEGLTVPHHISQKVFSTSVFNLHFLECLYIMLHVRK